MVISPDEFRQALGHFATGVTIVTTSDGDGRPTGLTARAFTSVSLDPPLVLVCVDHKSQSYPALRERGRFAVNILRRDQQAVSRRFASTRLDKFDEVPFHVSAVGLPLIDAVHTLGAEAANSSVRRMMRQVEDGLRAGDVAVIASHATGRRFESCPEHSALR